MDREVRSTPGIWSRWIALVGVLALAGAACTTPAGRPVAAESSSSPAVVPAAATAAGPSASPAPVPTAAEQPSPTPTALITAAPAPSLTAAAVPSASAPTTVAPPAPTSAATPVPTVALATAAPTPTAKPIAPTAVPGPATTVVVTLTNVAISLAPATAPSGTVTFRVSNAGSVIHELAILKTDQPQNQLPPDPTKPAAVQEPGLLTLLPDLAPGATSTVTLSLPSGSYVLICNQPAHYLVGMHTAFTVN